MLTLDNKLLKNIYRELWEIRNPQTKEVPDEYLSKATKDSQLSKKECIELSTYRNRNLITTDEQKALQNTVVAFFGLSVGSHAAITWVMGARPDKVIIIDPDTIDATNLNRIKTGWKNVGRYKVEVVCEEIKNIHPFIEVSAYRQASCREVFDNKQAIDIIVDEVDDIKAKIELRRFAKKLSLPIISAADVGYNVILDIERYDIDPTVRPFLGRISQTDIGNVNKMNQLQKKKLIIKLVGFEANSEKMLSSLIDIGKTIPTWPQLGATATITGGLISSVIKKIILKERVKSGRYIFSLDDLLVSDFNLQKNVNRRKKLTEKILQSFK